MSVIVKGSGGGSAGWKAYYIQAQNNLKSTDSAASSNLVSITGTNSTFTDKQKEFGGTYTESNITANNSITVRFTKAVKAVQLIYEAYAQNTGSRQYYWCALEGSNDGSTWTQLVYKDIGESGSHSSTPHVIDLTTKGTYTYYRYSFSTNNYIYIRHPFDLVVE